MVLKFRNFITRKAYDLTSQVVQPVPNPLRPTYENKEQFLRDLDRIGACSEFTDVHGYTVRPEANIVKDGAYMQ